MSRAKFRHGDASRDFGSLLGDEKRQLVAGIAMQHEAKDVIGKQVPVLCNLEPAKIRGVESNGMILCAAMPEPVLLAPQKKVPNGSKVK